jgi:tyrosyl-tRNA synthetase
MHPKEAKLKLAQLIVTQYYSRAEASRNRLEFERVFSQKELPKELATYKLISGKKNILEILIESNLVATKNEARRLIKQGAVYLDAERIGQEDAIIDKIGILKVGKRRFLKLEK